MRASLVAALLGGLPCSGCAGAPDPLPAAVQPTEVDSSPPPTVQEPPVELPGDAVETASNDSTYVVAYRPLPGEIPLNEEFELELWVLDAVTRTPVDPAVELTLDGRMPDHGHGLRQDARVERSGPGTWRVQGLLLHMTGSWELHVDVREGPLTERAQFAIELE